MATQTNQEELIAPSKGEIIIYQTVDGRTSIDVKLENETVWLTQAQMAVLFDKDKRTISEHITNIFKEGELTREVVIRKFRTTTPHGAIQGKTQTHEVVFYNLDVIISGGYRVKSKRGTQFRIWANSVLKEYLIKGYAVKNNLVQQKYDNLKALVDVMGRTMGYQDSPTDDQIRSTSKEYFHATYENAKEVISSLKVKFGGSDYAALPCHQESLLLRKQD